MSKEVQRRRTFAIISHPDAGKTTLTEKLLLYGGAIHTAGAVKAKRASLASRSDWMELEKKRGISVTTSVMQFDYQGIRYNLLDTPGHQDFSEDTYRTLMAADCAIMLIDAAKGVEAQTEKLFKVCKLRSIPVVTLVNKLDRPARDTFELLAEIEEVLGLQTVPRNWPIGSGQLFQGVYDIKERCVLRFERTEKNAKPVPVQTSGIEDPRLEDQLGKAAAQQLREEVELIQGAGESFDETRFRHAEISPVFFGSALTNFGIETFLHNFTDLCPCPGPRSTVDGHIIEPDAPFFSGFVFKVQANMDPAHRDRIAFVRVCSGQFEGGMRVQHARLSKEIRLAFAQQFMAKERTTVSEAFAGDVIGLHDTGLFRIGDTLCTETDVWFDSVPRFSPEHFARLTLKDPMKRKQLQKGILQLSEEGAAQLFFEPGREKDPIIGVVGKLQFDVLMFRLENEYGAPVELAPLPYTHARWVHGPADLDELKRKRVPLAVHDIDQEIVALFRDEWEMQRIIRDNESWEFGATVALRIGSK